MKEISNNLSALTVFKIFMYNIYMNDIQSFYIKRCSEFSNGTNIMVNEDDSCLYIVVMKEYIFLKQK